MPQNKFCPICVSYMLTLTTSIELFNHKKCPTCGWQEDPEGYNLLNPKPKTKGEANEPDQDSETKGDQ